MLEHKIQQAFSHATPDVWDSIRLQCEEELKNEEHSKESNISNSPKKKRTWNKTIIGLVASILLLLTTVMGIRYIMNPKLIGSEIAQYIVMHDAYPNGHYSLIDCYIRETVKDGVYSYEIQFRTKEHKAYYEVDAQTGQIINCILERQ